MKTLLCLSVSLLTFSFAGENKGSATSASRTVAAVCADCTPKPASPSPSAPPPKAPTKEKKRPALPAHLFM